MKSGNQVCVGDTTMVECGEKIIAMNIGMWPVGPALVFFIAYAADLMN